MAELLQFRQREGIPIDAFLLVYLGSLGTWYRLPEMMSFFSLLLKKKENARFLFLSGTTPEFIKQAAEKKGIDTDKLVIKKVQRTSVPIYLSIANLGICFLQQTFSKMASSPVKLGEMLAMGLPVVCNDAGDCPQMIKHGENGLLLPDLKNSTIESAVDEVLRSSFAESEAIRAGAFGKLSLEKGIDAYSAVYDKILSR